MPDDIVPRRKLNSLVRYLDELKLLANCTLPEYQRNFERRHAIEKLIELVVEYAIDINRAILEAANQAPPQTYYNTFIEMQRLGLLSAGLAPRLASTTGLRNRLVHRYDEIDNPTVYHSLKPLLKYYRRYAGLIEDHLQPEAATNDKRKRKK